MSGEARSQASAADPFGGWLLRQRGRDDYIGQLARVAARDRGFPAHGKASQVYARVTSQAFDQDTVTALEDALTEWRTMLADSTLQRAA